MSFADSAASFIASRPDAVTRHAGVEVFLDQGLPTASDEVWRYAPLGELSLDRFEAPASASNVVESPFATALGDSAGLVVRVCADGFIVDAGATPAGVSVESVDLAGLGVGGRAGRAIPRRRVRPAQRRAQPRRDGRARRRRRHRRGAPRHPPRGGRVGGLRAHGRHHGARRERDGRGVLRGGAGALVVPLSEFQVEQDAALRLVTYQRLDASAWHIGRSTAFLDKDARMRQAVIGMGSHYYGLRNDAEMIGGSENELGTTYLGTGTQVHDFRTRQFHVERAAARRSCPRAPWPARRARSTPA